MCVCFLQHFNLCPGFLGHLVNSQGIIDSPGDPEKALSLKEELASPKLTREKLDAMMKEFVDTAKVCNIPWNSQCSNPQEKGTLYYCSGVVQKLTGVASLQTPKPTQIQEGTCVAHGWPKSSYVVSKIGWSALSRIQQREMEDDPRDDIVVSAAWTKSSAILNLLNVEGTFLFVPR